MIAHISTKVAVLASYLTTLSGDLIFTCPSSLIFSGTLLVKNGSGLLLAVTTVGHMELL